jgi:hypothetical protein
MPPDVMEEEISPHMQFTHSFARVFNEGFRSMLFHTVIVLISFSFLVLCEPFVFLLSNYISKWKFVQVCCENIIVHPLSSLHM